MERGGAQAVPCRPGEAGQGRLARHRQELRADEDPDAGRQPRAEVLPPAEQHGEEEAPVQPLRHGADLREQYEHLRSAGRGTPWRRLGRLREGGRGPDEFDDGG